MKTTYAHHKLETVKANKQKTPGSKKVCRRESQAKTIWIGFPDDNQLVLKISFHKRKAISLFHSTDHRTLGLESVTDAEMVNSA